MVVFAIDQFENIIENSPYTVYIYCNFADRLYCNVVDVFSVSYRLRHNKIWKKQYLLHSADTKRVTVSLRQ